MFYSSLQDRLLFREFAAVSVELNELTPTELHDPAAASAFLMNERRHVLIRDGNCVDCYCGLQDIYLSDYPSLKKDQDKDKRESKRTSV